jgi:hypothetical protein
MDLGSVEQGSKCVRTFDLVNQAKVDVRITKVVTSCDCVQGEMSTQVLAPGAHGSIDIAWEIGRKRGKILTQVLIGYVIGTDKNEYLLPLQMRAAVDPDFDYTPDRVVFDREVAGMVTIVFTPKRFQPMRLLDATCSHRAFSAVLRPDRNEVAVQYDPRRWSGDRDTEVLTLRTNSPRQPLCSIELVVQ